MCTFRFVVVDDKYLRLLYSFIKCDFLLLDIIMFKCMLLCRVSVHITFSKFILLNKFLKRLTILFAAHLISKLVVFQTVVSCQKLLHILQTVLHHMLRLCSRNSNTWKHGQSNV